MENKFSVQDVQFEKTLSQNNAKDKEELEKKVLFYKEYAAKLACYNAFRRNVYASLHKLLVNEAQISYFGCSSKIDEQGDTIISFAFAGGVEPIAKRYRQEKSLEMRQELQEKLKYLDDPKTSAEAAKYGEIYVLDLVDSFATNFFNVYQMDWIDGKLN